MPQIRHILSEHIARRWRARRDKVVAIDIARRWRAVFLSQFHGYAEFGKIENPLQTQRSRNKNCPNDSTDKGD